MNNIDKRLLAYKPISVTLNFDWENTTYDERVQMRHDYIEEQKKLDPNYVGFDFPEHFSTWRKRDRKPKYIVDFSKLINTLGQVFRVSRKLVLTSFGVNTNGYREINFSGKENKNFKIHRLVACTFIPIPDHLKESRYTLVINHKNDIKNCNIRSNLEWCTNQENAIKAVETGAIPSTAFKFTITRPGELFGKEYYFTSKHSLRVYGFSQASVHNAINKNKSYLCGKWECVTKEELENKRIGMEKNIIDYIRDPKYGNANATGWVGTIVSEGSCKGEQFVLFGRKQLNKFGFNHLRINDHLKGRYKSYKGCVWKRMTKGEAVGIPIGLTETQKEHLLSA